MLFTPFPEPIPAPGGEGSIVRISDTQGGDYDNPLQRPAELLVDINNDPLAVMVAHVIHCFHLACQPDHEGTHPDGASGNTHSGTSQHDPLAEVLAGVLSGEKVMSYGELADLCGITPTATGWTL